MDVLHKTFLWFSSLQKIQSLRHLSTFENDKRKGAIMYLMMPKDDNFWVTAFEKSHKFNLKMHFLMHIFP